MNSITIIGNLTADPVSSVTVNGVKRVQFNVAADRERKDKEGNRITDFYRVTCWRGQADYCEKYLKKGYTVSVTGGLAVSTFEGRNGNTMISMDIDLEKVFIFGKREKTEKAAEENPNEPKPDEYGMYDVNDEEIPF